MFSFVLCPLHLSSSLIFKLQDRIHQICMRGDNTHNRSLPVSHKELKKPVVVRP